MKNKNSNKIQCDYCGNKKLTEKIEDNYQKEPFGDIIEFKEKILKCDDCGEEISFTLNYTDDYEKAKLKSEKSSILNILNSFQKKKISFTDIENSLELPTRTLSRWKQQLNYSKIGLTLLRIVKSYPWIILVAAKKFDKKVTEDIFKKAAMKKFDLIENNNTRSRNARKRKELSTILTKDATNTYTASIVKTGFNIIIK